MVSLNFTTIRYFQPAIDKRQVIRGASYDVTDQNKVSTTVSW